MPKEKMRDIEGHIRIGPLQLVTQVVKKISYGNARDILGARKERKLTFYIIVHSKYFSVSDWLKSRIIRHRQLLLTKFGRRFPY